MTHCHGSTHVYLGLSDICICGASRWGVGDTKSPTTPGLRPPGGRRRGNVVSGMIPKPYTIPYVPNPHHPRYQQQQPEAADVPLTVFRAAVDAKAQFLSADGSRAYRADRGNPEIAHWDRELKRFDSWWATDEVPGDAAKVDS